jgi:hypothetical protein
MAETIKMNVMLPFEFETHSNSFILSRLHFGFATFLNFGFFCPSSEKSEKVL